MSRSQRRTEARSFIVPLIVCGAVLAVLGVVGALLIGLNLLFVIAMLVVVLGGALLLLRRRRHTATRTRVTAMTVVGHVAVVSLATLVLSQAIPYGHRHSDPPVTGEPPWASPRTRELAVAACFNCHSNQTSWPWYASVAPISWAVADHVAKGRSVLNFSEFDTSQEGAHNAIRVLRDGSMPPGYYTDFGRHPEAKLSDAEVAELIAGLTATPGFEPRGPGR